MKYWLSGCCRQWQQSGNLYFMRRWSPGVAAKEGDRDIDRVRKQLRGEGRDQTRHQTGFPQLFILSRFASERSLSWARWRMVLVMCSMESPIFFILDEDFPATSNYYCALWRYPFTFNFANDDLPPDWAQGLSESGICHDRGKAAGCLNYSSSAVSEA